MRQNNKNNRSRGRGGRKGPNPLTRSYESNGPDVKVRGTAQHVAEKYMTLARDALSAGDGISAEAYFQYAEHYNRIIMAAQAQQNSYREEERRNGAGDENDQGDESDRPMIMPGRPALAEAVEDVMVQPRAGEDRGQVAYNAPTAAPVEASAPVEGSAQAEPEQKPRRRRMPVRPRRTQEADLPANEPKKANSDSLADNPPAFLMSE